MSEVIEFIPGQWVECVEPGDFGGVVLAAGFYRVQDTCDDSADIYVEGVRLSWNKRRFRPVEWKVGKTYKTTLEDVTATIETIGYNSIIGKGSNAFLYRCEWHPKTGRMLDLERVDGVPHLTPYLAEPSPAVETTEAKKVEPQPTPSRYHRTINGVTLDLYDVAEAWGIDSHRVFHALKKLIMAGRRGHKDRAQDLREAVVSIESELRKMKGGA